MEKGQTRTLHNFNDEYIYIYIYKRIVTIEAPKYIQQLLIDKGRS